MFSVCVGRFSESCRGTTTRLGSGVWICCWSPSPLRGAEEALLLRRRHLLCRIFPLSLSANSVSVTQGGTSSAVNVSVSPSNGFTGNVQVTLSGLPAGVTSNPASPFDVTAGTTISAIFGAATNAATGNFSGPGRTPVRRRMLLSVNRIIVTSLTIPPTSRSSLPTVP